MLSARSEEHVALFVLTHRKTRQVSGARCARGVLHDLAWRTCAACQNMSKSEALQAHAAARPSEVAHAGRTPKPFCPGPCYPLVADIF